MYLGESLSVIRQESHNTKHIKKKRDFRHLHSDRRTYHYIYNQPKFNELSQKLNSEVGQVNVTKSPPETPAEHSITAAQAIGSQDQQLRRGGQSGDDGQDIGGVSHTFAGWR